MKKVFFLLSLLFLFGWGACKKDSSGYTESAPNVITLNIDGKQYQATGNKSGQGNFDKIESAILKENGSSIFYLYILGGNGNSDFYMLLDTKSGPANGLGTFQTGGMTHSLTERFSGGEAYDIIGGSVTISKSEPKLIEGTLTLQLQNTARTKTVTGTFLITDPIN